MRRLAATVALLFAALLAWVAAGPWMTMRAIGNAVRAEDHAALSRHIDFPPLRASLKAQLGERLVRSAGIDRQAGLLGSLGATVANGLAGGAVDLMVTPQGLGALMEGRKVWNRARGLPPPRTEAGAAVRPDPWHGARRRYESPSRFTIAVPMEGGAPVVFVLSRTGLRWKLSDIRLPPPSADAGSAGNDRAGLSPPRPASAAPA
ncbi:DUF2939 domain-containing protein [Luteimonas wenzhouensis]|uniref:DUF2939 domain-containing protein n=1 Tax=Luteimonas wenzhouensis TaxID=2599615 RepID=A0A5C5U884_9GAMM|nr:DUF2939 domain-containing protein [Luteimonas wenzhouensis]TWT21712.1 DUF2939 domain-containing protein [Luteimonas wenzhouensis]